MRKVEAWVVVRGAEAERLAVFDDEATAKRDAAGRYMRLSNNIRAVRLVEHQPTAEAVLRAAVKVAGRPGRAPMAALADEQLLSAVRRHLKATKEKRK